VSKTTCTSAPTHRLAKEGNWIQTVPGQGLFATLRLCGPLFKGKLREACPDALNLKTLR